jgi:uncharacterized membrane protein YbaN (DUF454 family)
VVDWPISTIFGRYLGMIKPLYLVCGFVCLLLSIIGILLPLLPTTPFILVAAFCFSRSSSQFHQMLLNHRIFGELIKQWEAHGVIPFKVKCLSTTMMMSMTGYTLFFKDMAWWVNSGLVITMLIALSYIWSRPSHHLN